MDEVTGLMITLLKPSTPVAGVIVWAVILGLRVVLIKTGSGTFTRTKLKPV